MTAATNAQHSAESSDWYTPPEYIEAARQALGGTIDLDPATSPAAQVNVKARSTCYANEDGLARVWAGAVFCNPPTPPRLWWEKLARAYVAGAVPRAVFIAYSLEQLSQSQRWAELAGLPSMLDGLVCIPRRRIAYLRSVDGRLAKGSAPPHASAIVGLGIDRRTFAAAFGGFGRVL